VNLDLPPYENRCRVLVMDTLRDVARVPLVFDLLSGKIDSPKLLSQINLSVPSYQTRRREFLFVELHRTNYGIYEPINAAVRGFDEFAGLFDFNITRDTFLKRIKSVLARGSSWIRLGYCGVDGFRLLPETSTDTRNLTDCSKLCILELEHALSVRHKSVDK
jgi:hypothetical protein